MSGSNYTDLLSSANFKTISIPITPSSGFYDINFAFLAAADVNSVDYGTNTDYYNTTGSQFFTTEFGTAMSSLTSVEGAVRAITNTAGTIVPYTDYYSDVANISFAEKTDTDSSVAIQLGTLNDATGSLFSHPQTTTLAATIPDGFGPGQYGDIWLNTGLQADGVTPVINWTSVVAGGLQFETLLHELGHALGLQHPSMTTNDSPDYTIMSAEADTFPGMSTVYLSGLQMDDILAIQSIYGANYSTRSGNDAYGLGHGFGAYASTTPAAFVYTIWDGGGVNVIDASSYTGKAIINLNQGQFSSIGPADSSYSNPDGLGTGIASNNVAIAEGAIIQNAIGTQDADIFIGNPWNNVLAGSGTGGDNTFYSDQMIYSTALGSGDDWSNNGSPLTVSSQWSDPNYITVPTMKDDVLIGYGANNTFYSGKGDNVIDGGYNKTDINTATSSWGTYWDSAHQFTATPITGVVNNISGVELANIADSSAIGNVVDYSRLSSDDSAVAPGSPGITFLMNSAPDQGGNPIFTVQKGAFVSGSWTDGTDTLINIQYLFGSGANDLFVLPNGTGGAPLSIIETGTGHNTYILPMTTAPSYSGGAYINGDIFINDTTGHGDVVLQALPGLPGTSIAIGFGYYASEPSWMPTGEFPSGDKIMEIEINDGATGSGYVYLDMTAAAAGTGVSNVEIGGINFSAQALATYELGLGIGFNPSGGTAGLVTDIYGTSPTGLLPGPIYDTTTGQITGMAAPSYASSGAGNFVGGSFATEIDHPWVITGYAGALGGPGDVTINIQTYIDAAILNVAASDVRIVWGGPSSDTLTVYAVSEAQSFTIQDFTQGMTIHGIGFLGNEEYNALASHLTGLTASSPGNYSGGFSDSTGVAVGTGFDVTYWLENMFFSDGTGWNMQSGPLTFTSATDGQNLYSRDGYNDTLVALNNYDVLTGSTGNTTMVAGADSALYQGTGTDTDVFSTGASPISGGGDAVELNTSGGTASIVLHGITPSAVTMWDTGAGEFLIQYSSTDVIRVYGGTDGSSGFTMGSLTGVTFDDTTHWNLTGGLNLTATTDYQPIYGTTVGGDTLTALGTGDSLNAYGGTETLVAGHGAYLYNGTGNDTDVFSAGTAPVSGGGDHVYEGTGSGTTTVAFHGIDPSAVTMWDDNYGHLTIQFSSTDQITVLGGSLDYTNGFTLGSLTQITFDDTGHTTWDLTGGLNLVATSDYQYLYGTTGGGDTLTATGTGNTLYAYAGAETLVAGPGANLYNGTGNDIDVINSGSSPSTSSATIHANASGGTDNVIQVHDVVSADITMWDDTYGNLTVATPSDQFTIAGGSYSGTTGFAVGNIDHITLDDSSTIGLQGSLNLTAVNDSQTIYGTGHGDNMTAAGNYDYLYGIAGNNTMTGDSGTTYFYGGSGNDTMVAGSGTNYMTMGTGSDEIKVEGSSSTTYVNGFNASNDTIHLEDVMTGYDSLTDALSNWAQKTEVGGSTVIAVDPTGAGSFTAGPQVTLNSVTGLDDLATLVAHGVVHV